MNGMMLMRNGLVIPSIPFVMEVTGNSFELPYYSSGSYSGTIDWGDGTVVANTYANRSHTYSGSGTYDVSIDGVVDGWNLSAYSYQSADKILKIKSWGGYIQRDSASFYDCGNLTNIDAVDSPQLINTISMFSNCYNLSLFNGLEQWDLTTVDNVDKMFKGNSSLDLDLSLWDYSNIDTVGGFIDGGSFSTDNYDKLLIKWNQSTANGGLDVPNMSDKTVNMGTATYSNNGSAARASLIAKGMVITDGGQEVLSNSFIMEIQGSSFTLPYGSGGTYSGTIDFGDGTVVANSYANRSHTYAVSGIYDITITGVINGFTFFGTGDTAKVLDVKQWGDEFLLLSYCFYNCVNMDITATDTIVPPSGTMKQAFRNCPNLINSNNSMATWDMSSVTNLDGIVQQNSIFNVDISNWDTSEVIFFSSAFRDTISYSHDISNWNFKKAKFLSYFMTGKTFNDYDAEYYDNLLIKWDSDNTVGGLNVAAMSDKNIQMGTIRYTSVGASARASLVSKGLVITDGGEKYIPSVNDFKIEVTGSSFTLPYEGDGTYSGLINFGDGTIVPNTYANRAHTYSGSGTYDIAITGTVNGWKFANGGDRTKINVIKQWGNSFTIIDSAFQGCANLDITATDSPLPPIGDIKSCFRQCSSLVNANNSMGTWDMSNVTSLNAIFYLSSLFNSDISGWNTSNIELYPSPFNGALSFNYDVSGWDFTKADRLDNFMLGKTYNDYDATYYDNLLIKWDADLDVPNMSIKNIGMGTIRYTSAGASAHASLVSKGLIITDGGQV